MGDTRNIKEKHSNSDILKVNNEVPEASLNSLDTRIKDDNAFDIIGAIIIVVGLYTEVWGKSKDLQNERGTEKGEGQDLPVKDDTRSSVDSFDKKLKGPAPRT
ncbi:WAT1-related protein [Senna tora]|uniref:WAT1-related protein n=1 Tax=Senna tora TaxID=362788 RepID=A0A834X8R5_9FABA|nr:WAT1-related protein [Senna tora]